jgi:uncharacterized membrane protein
MARRKQAQAASGQQSTAASAGTASRGNDSRDSPAARNGGASGAMRQGRHQGARRGRARTSRARHGTVQPGKTQQGNGQPGRTRQGAGQPGKARQGNGRPGTTRQGNGQQAQPTAALPPERTSSRRAPATPPAPRWLQLATLILSLCGLGVSIYTTIVVFQPSALVCSSNGLVDCSAVLTSPESVIFGIHVAELGLVFFAFMIAVNSPWAWRSGRREVHWARLGGIIIGMAFVLYLIYVELIDVGKICLWCTSVHVLTFLLFALIVVNASLRGVAGSPGGTGAAARARSS